MTVKVVLAVLSGALAVLFSIQQYRSNEEMKRRAARGRVPVAIEDAKANNQKEVTLPAPIPNYAAVRNLDDALRQYTAVIAQPISKLGQLDSSGEIHTWYKVRIIDFVSRPVDASCRMCAHPISVPVKLQPVAADEIVFTKNGGTVVSDGIQATTVDEAFPDLEVGRTYLCFISLDASTKTASLELGPTGVVAIEQDGSVSPISERNIKLHAELKSRYATIDKIKRELKFRPLP